MKKGNLAMLARLRFAALAHDLAELTQVGVVVVEAPDETRDGVLWRASRIRSIGNVQVGFVGPGVQHSEAHPAALCEAMPYLRDGMHRAPGGLVTRAAFHRQTTCQGQRERGCFLG